MLAESPLEVESGELLAGLGELRGFAQIGHQDTGATLGQETSGSRSAAKPTEPENDHRYSIQRPERTQRLAHWSGPGSAKSSSSWSGGADSSR